jgi:acyl transferase domain-containing protein
MRTVPGMTTTPPPGKQRDPHDPGRRVASPLSFAINQDGHAKLVGPSSAEDALNKAKLARLTARQVDEQINASDADRAHAQRADREAHTYALLSIAESLVELTRAVREINDRGVQICGAVVIEDDQPNLGL